MAPRSFLAWCSRVVDGGVVPPDSETYPNVPLELAEMVWRVIEMGIHPLYGAFTSGIERDMREDLERLAGLVAQYVPARQLIEVVDHELRSREQ